MESLREGLPWHLKSTAEFLDSVDPLMAINAGYKVGH
jgi:hypothetical protein